MGNVGTLVVPASFVCTFGSPVVDVWSATIPAQPAGTVVKYIVSAWHSGGGAEIFGNGPGAPCTCGTPTSSSTLATVQQYTVGSTTDLYWDSNGATAGAGATPTGTWGTSTFWSTVFDGTAATAGWTAGRNAVFSAGTDASGSFNLSVNGTQTAGNITVEEGSVTIPSGVVSRGANVVTINNGASLTIPSTTVLTGNGGIILNGGAFRNSNPSSAGTFVTAQPITIGPAGGTLGADGAAGIVTIFTSGSIVGPGNTLTKAGPGTFRNTTPTSITFSKLLVTGGLYQAAADNIFGAVPGAFLADAITLNGGAISANGGFSWGGQSWDHRGCFRRYD